MISKAFSLVLFLFTVTSVCGQFTVSGIVTDDDGAPLEGAEVYLRQAQTLSITDEDGRFAIENVKEGSYDIIIFTLGYRVMEKSLEVSESVALQFQLEALEVQELSEVVITQEREKVFALQKLKTVEGTAIYAGKKSEVILVENLVGNLATNNARQVYNQVVGLNIYEDCNAGLQLNIGGRGLDPNRSANFNIRQNGYDISADALGYPESYYTPPVEALSEIQVVRGAASLQYGSQFGGMINFKFRKPNPNKKIELVYRQTLGAFDLFTSFNSLSGTVGDFSYYTFFNYKQGQCFRCNSDFTSRNYYGQFGYQISSKTKLSFEATLFNYLTKQPGGLTDTQFEEDPTFTNRDRNWFKVDWKLFTVRLEHQFSPKTDFSTYFSTLNAERNALGFRVNRVFQADDPESPRELLVDNFDNISAETRLLTRYQLEDRQSVFLIGAKYYQSFGGQQQGPGNTATNADFSFATEEFPNYERQAQFDFPNLNLALFGENVFQISKKFSATPGFRWEYIKTESEGFFKRIFLDLAGNPLLNEEEPDNRTFERNFLLLGLGLSYKATPSVEIYGNISENYRSVTFNDIRIVNPSFLVDPDIRDEEGYTADLGVRGRWDDKITYDVGVFGLAYNARIGEIQFEDTDGSVKRLRGNIGDAFIYGAEAFADWNIKAFLAPANNKMKLNHYVNEAYTES
nr:TonB-dependent receptor [uncultured Allomuricauda sp.]